MPHAQCPLIMSLCINPHCSKPDNPDKIIFCLGCGSELLLQGRYKVVKYLGGGGFGKTYEITERNTTPKVLKNFRWIHATRANERSSYAAV
jgi:hypothetical protein